MASLAQIDPTLTRGGKGAAGASPTAEAWKLAVVAAAVAQGMLWMAVTALHGDLFSGVVFAPSEGVLVPPIGAALVGLELPQWAAVAMHALLLVAATGLVYRVTRQDHVVSAATQSAWLVALSPVGVAIFSDLDFGVAFVASVGAVAAARSNRYLLAGAAAGLALLTVPLAGLAWLAVVIELVRQRAWRSSAIGAIGAIGLPIAAVLGWGFWAGLAWDLSGLSALGAAFVGRSGWGPVWAAEDHVRVIGTLAAAVAVIVGAATIGKLRRVRPSYVVVLVASVCAGVLAGSTTGLIQALALAFPTATLLGVEMSQRPALEPALVAACALSSLCLYLT